MVEFEVYLEGGSPWGFRLQGGKEFRLPLKIAKVTPGGKAEIGGVRVGDHVKEINGTSTENLYHTESLNAVKKARYSLSLVLSRSDDDANVIQSVGIAPEETSTRISLKIGPKTPTSSAPSSPKFMNRSPRKIESFEETVVPQNSVFEESIPQGQSYMKRFLGSQENLLDGGLNKQTKGPTNLNRKSSYGSSDQTDFGDLGPVERARSKTLPKNYSRDVNNNDKLNRSSGSLSQKGPPNKAPDWYKQMYKEINSSIEGESHLYKLLTSDAKRGVFRQYDGATSLDGRSPRSSSPEDFNRSSTISTADVPRRLGGGRSVANNQHRKSLPNIHAANFNFMDPTKTGGSTTVQMRIQKPSTTSTQNSENRKSINSEWYRQLQKGGQIPETGLTSSATVMTIDNSKKVTTRQEVNYLEDLLKKDELPKPSSVNIEYNNPPDFLELRKQELKNKELEQEREQIREQREKERLQEEERLRKQKELDKLRIEAEEKKQKGRELEIQRLEEERKRLEYERKEAEEKKRLAEDQKRLAEEQKRLAEEQKRLAEEQKRLAEESRSKLPSQFGHAKYSFNPQGPGELEFKKGDTIHLLRSIDENWLEGEINGHVGIFPNSYIEYITTDNTNKKEVKDFSKVSTAKDAKDFSTVSTSAKEVQKQPSTKKVVNEESFIPVTTVSNVESAVDSFNDDGISNLTEEGLCKAKYTFRPESESELPFKKGDLVTIIRQIDENWFEGKLDDKVGIFPVNYVEVIKLPTVPATVKPKNPAEEKPIQPAKVEIDFERIFNDPKSSQTKSPASGVPVAKTQVTEGTVSIKNERLEESIPYTNGYTNSFSHINGSLGSDIDSLIGTGEAHRCIFSYKHTNDDEVDLDVGDIVYVLEKCDDGWFVGTSERTGMFGTFPGNYVKPL